MFKYHQLSLLLSLSILTCPSQSILAQLFCLSSPGGLSSRSSHLLFLSLVFNMVALPVPISCRSSHSISKSTFEVLSVLLFHPTGRFHSLFDSTATPLYKSFLSTHSPASLRSLSHVTFSFSRSHCLFLCRSFHSDPVGSI